MKDEKLKNALILIIPFKITFLFLEMLRSCRRFNVVVEIFLFFYIKENHFGVNICTTKKKLKEVIMKYDQVTKLYL